MKTRLEHRSRLRRWSILMVRILLILSVVWIIGDFSYSRYVAQRIKKRESEIERDSNGVQAGCQAYHEGEGDEAILFVHGINDSPRIWRRMTDQLSQQGYHCVAMRLPGFAEPVSAYAATDRFEWIAAVHEQAKELSAKHDRVHLVAHSLGAAVSLQVIANSPELFDSVTLLAPAIDVSNERSPILSTRFWHNLGRWTLLFTRITESPFLPDAYDEAEQKTKLRTPFTPVNTITETFKLIDANRETASQFNKPLLLVLSKEDAVIDNAAAKEFAAQNQHSMSKIFFTEKSGHSIPMDASWKSVTEELQSFLQEEWQ